jgi:hypothetical protein
MTLPTTLTMVPCRECAIKRAFITGPIPGSLRCTSYDIPELGLTYLHKDVAERIVQLWNIASD